MKVKVLSSILVIVLMSCVGMLKAQEQLALKDQHSVMTAEKTVNWESTSIDLGNIQKDIAADATFEMTNNTEKPIVIARVKSSCGCTVSSYERKAILPGESATIVATYNAKKVGSFRKSLTVLLNDDSKHILSLKGKVMTEEMIVAK